MDASAVFTDVDMQEVAERLFLARHRLGLRQATVATCADLSPTHYNEIERGKVPGLRVQTLYRLCQVLRVSSDYLLGLPPPPAEA